MLVTLLIPVSAILLGILLLNETLQPQHFVGAGMIGSALLIFSMDACLVCSGPQVSLANRCEVSRKLVDGCFLGVPGAHQPATQWR